MEHRTPHPKIVPLPAMNAPEGCELAAHTDEAYFKEHGCWIQYYKDGRYLTLEQVQAQRKKLGDDNIFYALHKAVENRPDYDPNAKLEGATLSPPFLELSEEDIKRVKEYQESGIFKEKK